jgi:peptidoglycan hydrolase CwlO-like protein
LPLSGFFLEKSFIKRLNEKYVSTMNENKVLQEHVKENEQEIENLNEKVNEKQETFQRFNLLTVFL